MKNISALLCRISDIINKWVLVGIVILMIALSLLLATSVFFRYVLNNSIYWSSEASRYLLAWLAFIGTTAAYNLSSRKDVTRNWNNPIIIKK